ncbi:MAG: helix-turn-helix domain-containing protein [Nannocystales bacterium]
MSATPFGRMLREWRGRRGLSQLALATQAETTPRHLSFIETGRSRPGRDLVLRLADAMEIPVRHRNALLEAAGLGRAYAERDLEEQDLRPFVDAVEMVLRNHDPYPGCAMDGYGQVRRTNAAFERLWPGALAMTPEQNIDAFFGPGPAREMLENWAELAWRDVDMRKQEAVRVGDARLHVLADRAEQHLADTPRPRAPDLTAAPVVCPRFRFGDQLVQTFSTVMRFEHANDVSLHELKVELIFPAEPSAAAFFRMLAQPH